MKGKIISIIGILGIIVTVLIGCTVFSSNDYMFQAIFILIGVMLSVIITVLGEVLSTLIKNKQKEDK